MENVDIPAEAPEITPVQQEEAPAAPTGPPKLKLAPRGSTPAASKVIDVICLWVVLPPRHFDTAYNFLL